MKFHYRFHKNPTLARLTRFGCQNVPLLRLTLTWICLAVRGTCFRHVTSACIVQWGPRLLAAIATNISMYCCSRENGAWIVIPNRFYATAISHAVKEFELKKYGLLTSGHAITFTNK